MKSVERKWTMHDIPSQDGRLAVVTGATSGIGFHTAKELARKRATVIMPAREMRKGTEAAERIEAEVPKAQLYLAKLDLAVGRGEAKGNPTAAFEPVITKDATVGRRLWDESERVTDMQFVISAPSMGIHDRPYLDDARQLMSKGE